MLCDPYPQITEWTSNLVHGDNYFDIYCTKEFFRLEIVFDPKFVGPKFFRPIFFLDIQFFQTQNVFRPNFFSDPTFFQSQHCFRSKFFSDPNFVRPKLRNFDTKLCLKIWRKTWVWLCSAQLVLSPINYTNIDNVYIVACIHFRIHGFSGGPREEVDKVVNHVILDKRTHFFK